ncbi:MAG TPA: hypothetical protein VHC21_03865 [Candidatus Saccharimonadales bacterium]|nr:hypothetical protein [Candidatus Saccharimonadales bacterium]
MKHHVIYVPGIGDNIWHVQSAAVTLWRFYGVRGHFHVMPWLGDEPYQPKFERLLAVIDALHSKGHKVSLVGASAGGSAVLNAYLARREKINAVVLICQKINHPEMVAPQTYAKNPAFRESLERLQDGLPQLTAADKAKIRAYYSPADRTVPHADSKLQGVQEIRLPRLKHGYAIVYAITVRAYSLTRFIKSTATN